MKRLRGRAARMHDSGRVAYALSQPPLCLCVSDMHLLNFPDFSHRVICCIIRHDEPDIHHVLAAKQARHGDGREVASVDDDSEQLTRGASDDCSLLCAHSAMHTARHTTQAVCCE